MNNIITIAVVLLVCLPSGMAQAQEKLPLSEILPQLLGNTIILEPTSLADQPNHQAHFKPGFEQLEVPGQFNRALLTLLSTYPVGSPSGGFTYTFDPALGTFRRTSESFGPIFAERALTIGRDRVSVGYAYQHASYDTFEGINLRQRDPQRGVTFYVPHIDCCSRGGGQVAQGDGSRLTPAFEGDLVRAELALRLTTDANVLVVNYGVRDRFDVGVTVPFVRVSMDASVLATIERLSTEAEPEIHHFPDGDSHVFHASNSAAGLGDLVVRSKYVFLPRQGGGVAGAVEVRLPTGDETNLLGTGGVQGRVFLIGSLTRGRFSPHINAGYTFSTPGALPGTSVRDEINVAAGFDLAVTPRATFAVDFLGRTLLDAGRLREAEREFRYIKGGTGGGGGGAGGGAGGGGGGGGSRPVEEEFAVTRRELHLEPGNLRLYFGSAGMRFTPWRSVLVTVGILFPMTEAGLRDRVTPILGLDYGF
jgi:Putative MetA-pathway of phenol degradation